jgi:xylulokinase
LKSTVLGADIGTTHCKAGLFALDGSPIRLASRPMSPSLSPRGYHSEQLWSTVASAIREVMEGAAGRAVEVVGVASMAEAGLLVDRRGGEPRTEIIPWFDTRSTPQAEQIARAEEPPALFRRAGLPPSFKYGLAKLLWLRQQDPGLIPGAVWLSVADYVVYRLTARMATDPSLAARTYAFRVWEGAWDEPWLRRFGFEPELFPEVLLSGRPAGTVTVAAAAATGLKAGTPVAVSGHDHVCALPAAGVLEPGPVLDSVGTAESLLGVVSGVEPDERALASGLALVPHVLPGRLCWLGGPSAAGGTVEWLRGILSAHPLTYEEVLALLADAGPDPTEILYFPYLSGSGGPCPDGRARGAFVGLSAAHSRSDLLKAALEGTAYQAESIRRAAERLTGAGAPAGDGEIIAVGGGARNLVWMQIKADVSGCRYRLPRLPEATALGAAMTAALGAGLCAGPEDLAGVAARWWKAGTVLMPDPERHAAYLDLYHNGYLAFQSSLHRHGRGQDVPGPEAP